MLTYRYYVALILLRSQSNDPRSRSGHGTGRQFTLIGTENALRTIECIANGVTRAGLPASFLKEKTHDNAITLLLRARSIYLLADRARPNYN